MKTLPNQEAFEITNLSLDTKAKITYWKVSEVNMHDSYKMFPAGNCKKPETALSRARKFLKGRLVVSGLLMHAETKPVLYSA